MTDLEMTRLCAEAIGLVVTEQLGGLRFPNTQFEYSLYDPLHDDAQAMALVKKFGLIIFRPNMQSWQVAVADEWNKGHPGINIGNPGDACGESSDLNRAIVECCSRLQLEKTK